MYEFFQKCTLIFILRNNRGLKYGFASNDTDGSDNSDSF